LARAEPDWPRYYASRDRAKAAAFCERQGGAGWFPDYDAALRDDRVTTVMVLTPPAMHLEWTLNALEAGKHVIVEKPAFLDAREFDLVEAAAARAERRVLVAENYAYKPLVEDLRWLFTAEPLGRLLFLQINALKQQAAEGWRTDRDRAGGGALFEGGIHWVSLLSRLGPGVRSVRALVPGGGPLPERSIQLLFAYDQGTVASLSYSWEVSSPLRGLRMSRAYGTSGSAAFESNGLFFSTLGAPWRVRFSTGDLLGYRAMFRDFRQALASGGAARFTLQHARGDVELVARAYRDAERRSDEHHERELPT